VKKDVAYPVLTIPMYIKILFPKSDLNIRDYWLDSPQVDLRVREDSLGRLLVPSVHLGVCCVYRQTVDQELAFFHGKEPGRLGPVGDEPERDESDDTSEEPFKDEDPAPATVASNTGHVGNCICKKLVVVRYKSSTRYSQLTPLKAPARILAEKKRLTRSCNS
jgi:hypothetical protein